MSAHETSSRHQQAIDGTYTSGDLKRILHAIADQISGEDERRNRKLSELHGRLDQINQQHGAGEAVPGAASGSRGWSEQQLSMGPAPLRSALAAMNNYQQRPDSDFDAGWDSEQADALARVHEPAERDATVQVALRADSGTGHPVQPLAQPAVQAAGPVAGFAQDELGMLFIEIADKLDGVMANMPTDAAFEALDARLQSIEARMSAAEHGNRLGGSLEDQIADIAAHIGAAQRELSRLDRVEAEIRGLAERMDDGRAAHITGAGGMAAEDLDEIARQISERMTVAAQETAQDETSSGDLRDMLQRFMSEQREGGEHTAMMLDTMQQALIRLLDRIDELEFDRSGKSMFGGYDTGGGVKLPETPVQPEQASITAAAPTAVETGQGSEQPAHQVARNGKDHQSSAAAKVAADGTRPLATESGNRPDVATEAASPAAAPVAAGFQPPVADASGSPEEQPASDRAALVHSARRAAQLAAKKRAEEEALALKAKSERGAGKRGVAGKPGQAANTKEGKAKSSFFRLPFTASAVVLLGLGIGLQAGDLISKVPVSALQTVANNVIAFTGEPMRVGAYSVDGGVGDASQPSGEALSAAGSGDIRPATETEADSAFVLPAESVREHAIYTRTAQEGADNLQYGPETAHSSAPVPASLDGGTATPNAASTGDVANATAGASNGRLVLPPPRIGPLSLRLAAANGDASAEFEVAARFAEGKGIAHDLKEASVWYKRSAAQGFAAAQYRLATLYERGVGVSRDLERAKTWYQRAAEQGHVKAMHNLGVLLAGANEGRGDYAAAAKWFIDAAELGLKDSQFNLAILFDSGLGVQRDQRAAYKWFAIAAKSGDEDAVRRMLRVKAKLTKEELAKANVEVERWNPKARDHLVNDARAAGELWKRRAVATDTD